MWKVFKSPYWLQRELCEQLKQYLLQLKSPRLTERAAWLPHYEKQALFQTDCPRLDAEEMIHKSSRMELSMEQQHKNINTTNKWKTGHRS